MAKYKISKKREKRIRKKGLLTAESHSKASRKLRKSSFSRVQRELAVFHSDETHYNQYEDLPWEVEEEEEAVVSETFEYDKHGNHKADVEIASQRRYELQGNELETSADFIALPQSSDDDDDDHNGGDSLENNSITEGTVATQNEEHPWILDRDHSAENQIKDWLTQETHDFIAYISPSKEEIKARNRIIEKLRKAVTELWPDAELSVFGSYATDLYLPGSDIDCVVNSKRGDKEYRQYLYQLSRFLKQKKLATQVEVVSKARVPIVKFVEPESQLHVDVSFERNNGVEAAQIIREWLEEIPGMRELVLVVKQFLHVRKLNDVHTGGLGGFSIICLVYSFLKMHPRIHLENMDIRSNLGVLLIEFFELYGKNFCYDDVAIVVSNKSPKYIPKRQWRDLPPSRTSFSLAIQDPGDSSNNISRSSYNLKEVKRAFSGAFSLLTNKCYEMGNATFRDRVGKTILGNVIKYRGRPRDFRDERHLVPNLALSENEALRQRTSRSRAENSSSASDEQNSAVFTDISDDEVLYQEEQALYAPLNTKTRHSASKRMALELIMGLDDDSTVADDTTAREDSVEQDQTLQKQTVDAQTRRDYWLSKANALATTDF